MRKQTCIGQYFAVTADARDNRSKQIKRLHDESLYCYKLKFFRYKHDELPEPAHIRTYWHFMKLTLPSTSPLNVRTFAAIMKRRGLSIKELRLLSFKMHEGDQQAHFQGLDAAGVIQSLFSEDELAFAAAQVLA